MALDGFFGVSFDTMFTNNMPNLNASCTQWGVPDDSQQEIADVQNGIQQIANDTGVDASYILAIMRRGESRLRPRSDNKLGSKESWPDA